MKNGIWKFQAKISWAVPHELLLCRALYYYLFNLVVLIFQASLSFLLSSLQFSWFQIVRVGFRCSWFWFPESSMCELRCLRFYRIFLYKKFKMIWLSSWVLFWFAICVILSADCSSNYMSWFSHEHTSQRSFIAELQIFWASLVCSAVVPLSSALPLWQKRSGQLNDLWKRTAQLNHLWKKVRSVQQK